MKRELSAAAAAMSFFLVACGGGGGGSDPTPTPTPTPTPAPTPTPTPTPTGTCPNTNGNATNGLDLFGTVSYTGLTSVANTFDSSITGGASIGLNSQTLASSGSIRVDLWAVSSSFNGGTISGHRIVRWTPNIAGTDFVLNGETWNVTMFGSGTTPPAGTYCIVMVLNRFVGTGPTCSSSDGFCFTDWFQFSTPATFN